MKIYTLAELKKLVREQSYKMAALRAPSGDRIVPFNKYKKTAPDLDAQFKVFETRLKSDMHPNGVYYVLLAHNINSARSPHEYPITKGKVSPAEIEETEKKQIPLTPTIIERRDDALTYDKAIEMNREIALLTAKVTQLEFEKTALLKQISDMEEEEEEDEALSEQQGTVGNLAQMFEQLAPTLSALADRYFNVEESKISLEREKLRHSASKPTNGSGPQPAKKMIQIGSKEHMELIDKLWADENEEAFNVELDKLQAKNPDAYAFVLKHFGIEESEEEEEEEKDEQ